MERVYKCDHCSFTNNEFIEMYKHEDNCKFNPKNRHCFTCEHSWDSGFDYSIPECTLQLDITKGSEEGNCKGWSDEEIEDEDEI